MTCAMRYSKKALHEHKSLVLKLALMVVSASLLRLILHPKSKTVGLFMN
jgi:hypothetical protein